MRGLIHLTARLKEMGGFSFFGGVVVVSTYMTDGTRLFFQKQKKLEKHG